MTQQEMTRHPGFTNWMEYILHLEDQVKNGEDPIAKYALHMQIARLWENKFLHKTKAIVHYQHAYKTQAGAADALKEARRIYWEMGRLSTLERLISLELEATAEISEQVSLYTDLAEAMLIMGDREHLELTCSEILSREPGNAWATQVIEDLSTVQDRWVARAEELESEAIDASDGSDLLFRAALFYRDSGDFKEANRLLRDVISFNAEHRGAVLLLEKKLLDDEGETGLAAFHDQVLKSISEESRSLTMANIGVRWFLRHSNVERATIMLDSACRLDSTLPGLFGYLIETYLQNGDVTAITDLVSVCIENAEGTARVDVLETAGDIWERVLSDASQAQQYYAELRSIDPHNEAAGKFFEENEMTNDSESDPREQEKMDDQHQENAEDEKAAEEDSVKNQEVPEPDSESDFEIDKDVPADVQTAFEAAEASEEEGSEAGIKAWQNVWSQAPAHPVLIDALLRLYEDTGKWNSLADFLKRQTRSVENLPNFIYSQMALAKIYDEQLSQDVMVVNTYQGILKKKADYIPALDAAIDKYDAMERWPDLVKLLKSKGGLVKTPDEKVTIWLRVAQLFLQRFSNQAEAIKAFEEVIAVKPDHAQALEFLKEMYEKRRDWEKLVGVMQREAAQLPEGADRSEAMVNIAKLATERLKRPAICIELWELVLEQDADNTDAFDELGKLYERAKEWEKLTGVLQKQAEGLTDVAAQVAIYQKLGVVYGDKVGDDTKAVQAWKSLLDLSPDDRRAQEQLKKRYLALMAWDELEEFYAATEKWDEFIRVLEREADKESAQVADRISLQFKIAELWRDKKERIDRAAKSYELVLKLDNTNLDAAEMLIPIFEENGKEPIKLADVLEVKLNHLDDDDERLALRQRIARLVEEKIGDADRAFEGFLKAFQQKAVDPVTQEDMERTAEAANHWEQVVEAYQVAFEAAEAGDRAGLQIKLARVLNEEVGRSDEALKHYDAILSDDPKNPRAVHALEKIFAQMGRYEELLEIYAKRIEMAEDDEERKDVLYNQALLWEDEINDNLKAIEVYSQIIKLAGDEQKALSALDRLYTKEEKWQELTDIIQRELDGAVMDEDEELEIKYRLGQISECHLNDKAKALECYREIILVDRNHEMSKAALEGLIGDAEQQVEAAHILAPLYEENEEWEQLVNVTNILIEHSDDGREKIDLLMKIGGIFSQNMDSQERAFAAYSRAFKQDPSSLSALEHLESITAILDSWQDLVGLLEDGGRTTEDPENGKDLWLRAARIHDTQLEDVDASINAYNSVLTLDSQNEEAIQSLEQIYSRAERWADLVDVLRVKVDATVDATEKEQIYRHMAMILEEMLEKPQDAIECMKEILNIDPSSVDALQTLDKLYVGLENWTDLADNLQQQLGLGGDVDRIVELKLRLAGLRETQLEEIAVAIEIYREVLAIDSEQGSAIEALERIIVQVDFRKDVAEILETIYRGTGEWEKLINVYEILIEEDETSARKIDLLHEISELYETVGDEPEKAFKTLGRALALDPSEERTQDGLDRLARVLVLYDDLVEILTSAVGNMDNLDLAASFHLKIAQICEEQLQDVDKAIKHYQEVLEIDSMHLEAATALEGAYQVTENYSELANIYLKKVEMVSDLDEQKNLLFRASQIYEEILENTSSAIEVYLRILEVDEDDLKAISQLEGLYLRLERWEDLQGIYNRKVDLVATSEEKKEVLYVLGAMYEREVQDMAKAIETYQRILEFDLDDFQAIQRLDMLYTESEEWHDLLSILEREVELTEDPDEAISFKYRIGELYVRYLDDVPRAIDYFKDILVISPDHDLSIQLLEQLVTGEEEPLLAAEVLEPLYQDLAEWRKLIGVLEVKLAHNDDEWQRVEILHKIAGLMESDLHLDVPSEAFDVYARALAEDKTNDETLTKLEELASQTGRWEDLAKRIDVLLEDVVEPEPAIALGLRVATIYEENLDSFDEAIKRFQKVLEFDAENRSAILRLDKLYQILERWEELTSVLQKEAIIMDSPEESLQVQFRLGQLYQQELEDKDKALEVYRDILASEPTHDQSIAALEFLFAEGEMRGDIVEILEPLHRMQNEWGKLVNLYESQLEDLTDKADRVAMQQRIAETYEERLIDPVEAFSWYCRAFAEEPFDERSGEEIERLGGSTDAWTDLADLYQDLFVKHQDDDVKRFVAKRLARVTEKELHDAERAEKAYRGCLSLGGDDLEVLEALDRIYSQYMDWDKLAEILEMLAGVTPSEDDRVEYIYRMGDVFETQLDEEEKARVAYHRVIDDLNPGHQVTLSKLEMIYVNREAWAELYSVYEKMKDAYDSDASQADFYAKMGLIAADCLDDIPKAIELWGNVLDILGEDSMALEALADLYSREENWSDLVDVLERAVTIAEEDDDRVKIYSQLGLVWGECLERDRNALENWQNVLDIDTSNIKALQSIALIHEANKDWEPLIETIERVIEVGVAQFEVEELKSYYAKLGTIFSDTVERPMDSIDVWKSACDIDPSDLTSLKALEKLYEGEMMWEEYVEVLGRKGDLLTGDDQVQNWLEQARAMEEKLEMPLSAKAPYMNIISVAPLHDHAFEKIIQILTEEESWEDLIQLYSNKLNYVSDPQVQVSLLHKAAFVYEEKLDQAENAFQVMQQAFDADYSNDETARHLERLASVTDKWNDLLASCNQVLESIEDKNTQISLCLKIGKWYADELGHPEYAIAYYQKVLQLDADNVAALKLMGALYRGTKQWPELVEVLKRAVESEEQSDDRKNLFVELGQIHEEYLDDLPEARKAYNLALEVDPGLESALNALERIFAASQSWRELIPILRRKIEVLSDNDIEATVSTHSRIAEILEDNLNDAEASVEEYRKSLELDEGHMPSLKGLERLFSKLEQWQNLLDVLEIQLEYASSERERIDLLARIAAMLEEEFVNPEKAAEHLEKVLEIDPNHESSLQSLERIYSQQGKWQDLIATLEKHIEATHDRDSMVDLNNRIGDTYSVQLDDIDRAMDAYKEMLDINPEHEEALDKLAKLQVKSEDWSAAHDTLLRLAETVSETDRKVDLYFRLGQLNEENLMDRGVAIEHLRSALDIEPGHLGSLAALRKIYIDEGEWLSAARVLETEQESTDNPRTRSVLQYDLGVLHGDKLSDKDLGIEWYEKALQSNPDNQDAAAQLVDVYVDGERWGEAEELLDMMIRLGGKREPAQMQPLHRKLGLVADKLDNLEKSLKAYQAAYDIDTSHLPTLLNLADVLFRREEWDKAFKLYQMVLVHHRDKQGKDEIVEIFYRLGNIKARVKERRKALNMFDKALEIDGHHVPTLEAIIELQEEQKNFDQVIHFKKTLIDSLENDDKKFELYIDIGDIWQGKLKNPQKAISSYSDAAEIKPENRVVLHKMLPLYQSTKQWQRVVEIIDKVADMEENKDKLGRLYYSMAVIYRDEVKSAEDSVEYFNKSLDASLENLKSFEAIDRILTQKKDWKELERNYRKMLHRIAGTDRHDLETNLWHFLGEIYRSRMGQYDAAAEAFKMAAKHDPDNIMRHEILAELYMKMPDKLDAAVAEHQTLIKHNPYRVESYKALRKLYFDHRQYDKAWCLCSTLSFLKKADAEEQKFFEQYRTRGTIRAQARLNDERWLKDVFHPDESVYLGKIFELVTRTIRSIKVQPIKVFGLKKNQRRPANDTLSFSKTFFYSAQVINLPIVPELYLQEDKPGGLNFAITDPMSSVCGASLLSGYTPQDLLFIVTKHLSYYRPEHYIRWILPSHGELKTVVLAALKLGAPDFKLPEDKTGVLAQYSNELKNRMNPIEAENLSKLVKKFIKSGEQADIKRWIKAVELTACRSAFLLSNDLETSAKMIQAEAGGVDDIPPKEKIKELVLFSVSEEYFRLRETLGITIGS